MAGGTTLAFLQAMLFMALAPAVGLSIPWRSVPMVLAALLLIAFGLTGLGFFIAWKLDSTQGFHAIMNLFLMPMWLLSGAVFPAAGAPPWLHFVMKINPLTYGLAALGQSFQIQGSPLQAGLPPLALCLQAIAGFALFTFLLSWWIVRRS
jgi:ABC-2 type transport system permease protein